ncbi:MAG: hypothetical protein KF767_02700 [Bdellovibrionaceae bacterium]|nr:hypothetical protein [Pseudobdellovibrionaceae bacterium]
MTLKRYATLTVAAIFLFTGCSNIYAPLANKDSDEARYEDAMKLLNDAKYSEAVARFESLSADFMRKTSVRQYYAGALAGKCGYSMAGFVTFLSTADFTTSPFFKSLMNQFTGRVVAPEFCKAAEGVIKSIWAEETPTASQQFFMVILSMSKIGAYLRAKGDIDGTDDLGDSDPDASFNVCNTSDFTDDDVKEVVTGFSLMLMNIGGFIGSMSGGTADTINDINAACGVLSPNPCATTEAANVDAGMITSMRNILNTGAANPALPLGIGSCVNPDITQCCP